ncbi:integrase core domain-containing protein [Candidatus Shapirobacteria bacterium]|nr:integrase core domain-containing protein [Candidatus Shapirobacteria bacterium]
MKDFYTRFKKVYPTTIRVWQSDNVSENLGVFDQELKKEGIPHLFIYPHYLKIDTSLERYKRTLEEECLNYHPDELMDIRQGNQVLADWNVYYNTRRRHHSLGLLSPMQYFIEKARLLVRQACPPMRQVCLGRRTKKPLDKKNNLAIIKN